LLIKLDEKTNQLITLRLESGEKDAGLSREELLTEKIRFKYEKLEVFANRIGINLQQVNDLCRYYERLIRARKSGNQVNIETHEDNIARVREGLRQHGLQIEDIQEFCNKCEEIAKLRAYIILSDPNKRKNYDAGGEGVDYEKSLMYLRHPEDDLDPSLWVPYNEAKKVPKSEFYGREPYKDWSEKLRDMPTTFDKEKGEKERKIKIGEIENLIIEEEIKIEEKEKELEEIKENSENDEIIKQLEAENKKLKEEIAELKKEDDNSPEFRSYLNKKENQLKKNEEMLREWLSGWGEYISGGIIRGIGGSVGSKET
ncbi:10007_t:CDS:10, partial [Gigaspora margarita]